MTAEQRLDSAYRYFHRDRLVEAWAELQAVPPSARNSRDFLMLVADVAPCLGKWHEATAANRQLSRMEPHNMLHWFSLAAAVLRSFGPLAASRIYAEAARHNPSIISYPYNHAAHLCESGRITKALHILVPLLERDPPTLQRALDDGRFAALADFLLSMEESDSDE